MTRAPSVDLLGDRWRALEGQSEATFFQSWTWIGSWLRALPEEKKPYLVELLNNDETIALGLAGYAQTKRWKVIRSRLFSLSEACDVKFDTLTVEYNGPLIANGSDSSALRDFLAIVESADLEWDEFLVNGLDYKFANQIANALPARTRCIVRDEKPVHHIDLARIRDSGQSYLDSPSSNTRSQIRRSIREYEKDGQVKLSIAENLEEAHEFLMELQTMHQADWQSRGQPGAFASSFSRQFHDHLLNEGFQLGQIQLARLTAGDSIIGYLYNFVYRGRVMNYQSGMRYTSNPKHRPGLVAHALAAQHNLDAGADIYDFLMGDRRYKRSLANAESKMQWLVIQKPRIRFYVEEGLRSARNSWTSILGGFKRKRGS